MDVQGIEQLDLLEAQQRIEDGALLVDVREAYEWNAARVPGAVSAPLSMLQEEVAKLPKDRPLVLMCAGGVRSQQAALWLQPLGFSVANVMHGIQGWARMGLPIEQDS